MFSTAQVLALLAAVGMFIFSAYMYLNTGDWVASVFALGSLCYFVFFLLIYKRNNP
jgi:hypothetical protein